MNLLKILDLKKIVIMIILKLIIMPYIIWLQMKFILLKISSCIYLIPLLLSLRIYCQYYFQKIYNTSEDLGRKKRRKKAVSVIALLRKLS